MVDIVIPIYKENPTEDDIISIRQVFYILHNYDITFIHPENLDVSHYLSFGKAKFLSFEKHFFDSILGYNKLMLDINFYEKFGKKYILIYQTDALVFKNTLDFWCKKDYDYIGAPWIGSQEKIPVFKFFNDKIAYFFRRSINYRNNRKWQKDKSLLYNNVGNGGLSLRKREKFIEIISHLKEIIDIYLDFKNKKDIFYAEDVFFSIEPQRNGIHFLKPNFKEACLFSIEGKIDLCLKYNDNNIPFGCHRWNKENKEFWKKVLDNGF